MTPYPFEETRDAVETLSHFARISEAEVELHGETDQVMRKKRIIKLKFLDGRFPWRHARTCKQCATAILALKPEEACSETRAQARMENLL